jgi:two-component system chemotaxis sensor kinase CheA
LTALRQRLLEVFEVEYQDHLEAIRAILGKADDAGDGLARGDLTEATRRAHSLKGAARAVGLEDVETLAHGLESLFIKVERGQARLDRDLARHVLDTLDEIEDRVVASQTPADGDAPATSPRLDDSAAPQAATVPRARSAVRVETANLDQLLKSAGELHSDMLLQRLGSQHIRGITQQMTALEADWLRLWKQLAGGLRQDRPDAHRANASRLIESGEQIGSSLKAFAKRLRAAADTQEQCARSLHHHLDDLESRVKAARMVPAESVFGGFRKMVRDVAASEGKQVEAVVDGLDCEADRLVLQRIKDPVMHILRNAVSHGIERPADRRAAGKAPEGRVRLAVSTARDRLSIVIEDDGRGLDFTRIADKAVNLGLMSRTDANAASHEALSQLLFEPGFSTADAVTKISGRGVGLSVAREAVTGLQGSLNVHAVAGQGTRIEIALPVSILSQRLLLVALRGQTYALPTDAVAKVLRIKVGSIFTVEGRLAIRHDGATLMLVSLGDVLRSGDSTITTDQQNACVVVLRGTNANVGVVVEGFIGVNDFVVRPLDIGSSQRSWSGIVATEDGTPCLVLNADVFTAGDATRHVANIQFKSRQRTADTSKVVLVVDDSITTRTLEKSILEAHGYKVRLSVDGRDAIAQLRAEPADIVVSDVEMPHVNGFELVRAMKGDKALAGIPVVLVTSRDDAKDREMGLRLGADAYVVKQKFDQADLLQTIRQII